MKIKHKISIVLLIFFVVVFIVLHFTLTNIALRSYLKLEEYDTIKETKKIKSFFDEKRDVLLGVVKDWAYWDDTYRYIEDKNKEYEITNLGEETLKNLGLNYMIICNADFVPVKLIGYDLDKKEYLEVPKILVEGMKNAKKSSGFLRLENGEILLFAFLPVYDLKFQKTNGYLAAGYLVNEAIKDELSKNINMRIEISGGVRGIDEEVSVLVKDDKTIIGSWHEPDIFDGSSIVFSLFIERNIYNIGKMTIQSFFEIFLLIFGFVVIVMFFFLKRVLWNRLDRLTEGVKAITFDSNHRIKPLQLSGNDELSLLKDSINDMVETIEDMTEKITKDEERYRALYEETAAIHILVDEYGVIKDTNRVILNIIGKEKSEFVGDSIRNMVYEEDADRVMDLIGQIILGDAEGNLEVRFMKKDGTFATILMYPTSLLISEDDNMYSILLAGSDITDRKEMEKKLTEHASKDAMTGTYNRRMGMELLEKYMGLSERTGTPLSICFIDVNNLKKVNDVYGHNAGDELIKDTAVLLHNSIRDTDILCRLGGDEFLIIFPKCNRDNAEEIWKRIEKYCDAANLATKKNYTISMSRGFAEYEVGVRLEYFVEMADNEMYEDKKRKKGLK